METRVTYILGMVLALALGCGVRDVETTVGARNLQTGEVETFASPDEVPQAFVICATPECLSPADPACEALGPQGCSAWPGCGWGQFNCPPCTFDEKAQAMACDCALSCIEAPQPPPESRCEDLTTDHECLAQAGCGWGYFNCPPCIVVEEGEAMMCDCALSCVELPESGLAAPCEADGPNPPTS
jgi:hypothetical protein